MGFQIIEGDCLEVMPTLEAGSIDAVVCDPPYGLKFMGKEWDQGVPGVQFWTEALRVSKPGTYLLAFGGTRTFHRLACAIEDAGWQIQDTLSWLYGSGFPKHKSKLKPAWEPVIMAWNADRKATHLNIDACRIATDWKTERGETWLRSGKDAKPHDRPCQVADHRGGSTVADKVSPLGRWPANVVLDEEAAALLDEQSGQLTSGNNPAVRHSPKTRDVYGLGFGDQCLVHRGTNSGGASRFFYTAKASRSEREAGLTGETHAFVQGYAASPESSPDREGDIGLNRVKHVRNNHPTVKPLPLMQWLCKLVTPKGGLILDPFCGSGTTGRAAVAEGFSFIGIEKSPEYAAIARARIAEYAPLFGDVT